MVNDLMVKRRDEFMESTDQGGSSYCNLDRLINDDELTTIKGVQDVNN